jgi:hypothetical protein
MNRYFKTGALLVAFVLLAGCDDDSADDPGAGLAALRGQLTLHGQWPAVGEIQVSLFPHWDTTKVMSLAPGGPPDFHTTALHSPTPTDTLHLVAYEIPDINPGRYAALVAGWRNGGVLGLDEPVLGMHGADFAAGDTLPAAVELAAGDEFEADFVAWLDLVPGQSAPADTGWVRGRVVFPGDWPTGYALGIYALLMVSGDPAAPSSPIAGAMQAVSAAEPDFALPVNLAGGPFSGHLAIYGYPFVGGPWASFYGGYGWDWQAGEPALLPVELSPEDAVLQDLTILCRDPE